MGKGAVQDFGSLLVEQIPRLRRHARALTGDANRADDLVQDCLYRALRKQHLFVPGTDVLAWLFTMLHNQNVNNVRRSMREGINIPVEDVANAIEDAPRQAAPLLLRDLDRALATLSEEQRQVVLLVGLEGFACDQVAQILDIPIGTVRSRLSRARKALRACLSGAFPATSRQRTKRRTKEHCNKLSVSVFVAEPFTILFVEDDDLIRRSVPQLLALRGFNMLVAEDGEDALRILEHMHVDVLFADIVMPGVNGIELAKRARQMNPNLKVILATGYFSRAAEAEQVGKLLFKPLRAPQIEAEIREMMAVH